MIIPPPIIDIKNKNMIFTSISIKKLEEYKNITYDILIKHNQYEIAEIIKEIIDKEIKFRKICDEISDILPEYIGV